MNARWLTYGVLALAVAVVSTASILVRYAQAEGMASITIAALRLTFATLLLVPVALPRARRELPRMSRRDIGLTLASGAALAVHFATWITSLEFTTVAASAALVTTNPVWVGIASALVLRERVPGPVVGGIALAIAGSLLVFTSAPGGAVAAPAPLLGNTLALAGAVAASAYLLIGRALRSRISLLVYVWLAYGSAAVLLLLATLLAGAAAHALSGLGLLLVFALAAGPQLIGHTAVNWAVRRASATVVALAILGEPVGAALLAWMLFDETFSGPQLAGFALLLGGIALAARAPTATGVSEPPA